MKFFDADVVAAQMDDPSGCTCGFCGGENDFADDCGWFYASIDMFKSTMHNSGPTPVCLPCWQGMIGTLHTDLHGLGDR